MTSPAKRHPPIRETPRAEGTLSTFTKTETAHCADSPSWAMARSHHPHRYCVQPFQPQWSLQSGEFSVVYTPTARGCTRGSYLSRPSRLVAAPLATAVAVSRFPASVLCVRFLTTGKGHTPLGPWGQSTACARGRPTPWCYVSTARLRPAIPGHTPDPRQGGAIIGVHDLGDSCPAPGL